MQFKSDCGRTIYLLALAKTVTSRGCPAPPRSIPPSRKLFAETKPRPARIKSNKSSGTSLVGESPVNILPAEAR